MKFTIAAKLGVLASAVALSMTLIVGFWSRNSAAQVFTHNELVGLADDAELCVYQLVNDFRYLRRDVYELTNPPARLKKPNKLDTVQSVRQMIEAPASPAVEQARASLLRAMKDVLEQPENSYYLEICCLKIDKEKPPGADHHPYHPLLAAGRMRTGNPEVKETHGELVLRQRKMLQAKLADARTARDWQLQSSAVQAFAFREAAVEDGITPMLLAIAFPIDEKIDRLPMALLVLVIDFEEYVKVRSRHLPRHLLFLTDDQKHLLIHPDPAVQQQIRLASAGQDPDWPTVEDEPALAPFARHYEQKRASQQQELRRQRGDEQPRVPLKERLYCSRQPLTDEKAQTFLKKEWQ